MVLSGAVDTVAVGGDRGDDGERLDSQANRGKGQSSESQHQQHPTPRAIRVDEHCARSEGERFSSA